MLGALGLPKRSRRQRTHTDTVAPATRRTILRLRRTLATNLLMFVNHKAVPLRLRFRQRPQAKPTP